MSSALDVADRDRAIFSVQLPVDLRRRLEERARREERSAGAVVRVALRTYLTEKEKPVSNCSVLDDYDDEADAENERND